MKTCPFCAETDLQDKAKVCKHCGKDIVKDNVALGIAARNRYSTFTFDVVFFWLCIVWGFYQLFFTDSLGKGIILVGIALIGRAIRLHNHKKEIIQEMELINPSINLSHPSNQQKPQNEKYSPLEEIIRIEQQKQQHTKYGQGQKETKWLDEKYKQGQKETKWLIGIIVVALLGFTILVFLQK